MLLPTCQYAGQANYAAANAALEAWAGAEAARGGVSTAVQWGAWAVGEPLALLMWHDPMDGDPRSIILPLVSRSHCFREPVI